MAPISGDAAVGTLFEMEPFRRFQPLIMFAQRIALLAERLGIPLPRVAGQSLLGLFGTIRTTRAVPLIFSPGADEQMCEVETGLNRSLLIETLNGSDVWTWLEFRSDDNRWRWPEPGGAEPAALVRSGAGDLPSQNVAVVFSTSRWTVRCVPARDRDGFFVLGVLKPRRAPRARLLVASFRAGADAAFDTKGMCTLIASQTRVHACIDQRQLERDAKRERDFITSVRRHLEALRNHAISSTPRAQYELIARRPVRLRTVDADAWPRAFARPGALLHVPTLNGHSRVLPVVDVSDDGEVLTTDADDADEELFSRDELKLRPSDDSLRRMREALDTIAMAKDESHGRLLEALTSPESLVPLQPLGTPPADVQTARQAEATALGLNTPDIALIHGPPGTGKTTVICGIVEELARRGQRVLLVAPTHVALDNVLERVGDRVGVTAIRLGSPDNVEEQAHRFLLQHRSKDLTSRLAAKLRSATHGVPKDDPVAAVQREWASRIAGDDVIGALLLLEANLVCATPIGIAMAQGFREVEVAFDVMIMDEASKATITDFLVPAARARKWILVGDHRQLAPYVDHGELEAVVSERVKRAGITAPDAEWIRELATGTRQHFDNRMHPDPERVARLWRRLVDELARHFEIDDVAFDEMVRLGADAEKWREAYGAASRSSDEAESSTRAVVLRLGAELLELQALALRSVFEHLTRLPASRSVKLNFQHRMAPELAAFSSKAVYDGDYPSAPETVKLGLDIPSLEAPAIWVDTAYAPSQVRNEYPRDRDWMGGDYFNRLEVDIAVELVETCAAWAVQSWRGDERERGRGPGASFEIGVTAFYLKQALRLRDAIFGTLAVGPDPWRRRWKSPAANGAPIDIHVSIVDRFQGREKDVIVLCTTRSNPAGIRGHVDNLNRLNVAVTRARHKRIVIGDSTTLAGQGGKRRRAPGDLLVLLYETSERKKKWGRALGGRS